MREHGDGQQMLRARAVRTDAASGSEIDLGLVWRELVNADSRVIDCFHSDERCYLLLEQVSNAPDKVRRAQAGKIRILESILLEGAQKNVAIELGLSPSTVAGALKQCLEQLGVPCTTSRISPILVSAAYASQESAGPRWGRVGQLSFGESTYRVVSVARPEVELARLLTRAQYEVVRLLIEGKTHVEIASSRCRSTRTIANQLGAAFRRLGVSGRSELLRRLIVEPAACSEGTPARTPAKRGVSESPRDRVREAPISVRRYRPRARRVSTLASM